MKYSSHSVWLGVLLSATAMQSAFAADIYAPEPVVIEQPEPYYEPQPVLDTSSFYIRGDVSYAVETRVKDIEYTRYDVDTSTTPPSVIYTPGVNFDSADLDESFDLGVGIGANIGKYLRAELAADYFFDMDFEGSTNGVCLDGLPCTSSDHSSVSILTVMANAYVDLGTYYGFTPYVGGGIGLAHVDWDKLTNKTRDGSFEHDGYSEKRFAYQLAAGASYCLTESLEADVGYRYLDIEGGRMFDYAFNAGPGYDDGFQIHDVKAGLRYNFGGANPRCAAAPVEPPIYTPPPVYK